jgi:uncharacterized membrane protein
VGEARTVAAQAATDAAGGGLRRDPRLYRIAVRGHLSDRFAASFDGFTAIRESGRTLLVGPVVDPSHLYAVLERLRDLGIELLSVESDG